MAVASYSPDTRMTADLNAQWRRLCDGTESAPTVAAALDGWRRSCEPTLACVDSFGEVLRAVEQHPDAVLAVLVAEAQAGAAISGRVVLQALLPKLVLMTRSQLRTLRPFDELLADACGALWELVATYPLRARPRSLAANLTLDTLKALRREGRDARVSPVPFVPEGLSAAPGGPVSDELASVLAEACRLGVIEVQEANLLLRVYRDDDLAGSAAEDGVSPGAIRKRCCLIKARLRRHAAVLS